MLHEEKWYSCDKCGKKLKNPIKENFLMRKLVKETELTLTEYGIYTYMCDDIKKHGESDLFEVKIVGGYKEKNKKIHLCTGCRKKFDLFMKNEV